jgi:hypothetical protein
LGHADLVQMPTGQWYAVCLGIRPNGYPPCYHLGRETFLSPVKWIADGFPVFGRNSSATELGRIAAGFSLVVLAYLGTGVFLHLAFERYYWFIVALTAAAAGVLEREARRVEIETSWTSWRHGSPTV